MSNQNFIPALARNEGVDVYYMAGKLCHASPPIHSTTPPCSNQAEQHGSHGSGIQEGSSEDLRCSCARVVVWVSASGSRSSWENDVNVWMGIGKNMHHGSRKVPSFFSASITGELRGVHRGSGLQL